MKSSRLLKIFEQYVKKYDMNNRNVKMKYFHSLKIMELSRDIASSLNVFTEEEIVVCQLIALFHDIGSFESYSGYKVIDDNNVDYSKKSLEILFDNGLIRDIVKETTYDNIIKISIFGHNKEGFPNGMDNKTKMFMMVIRDAHKIEYFRMTISYPYLDNHINCYPSPMVYNVFKGFKNVEVKMSENNSDDVLVVLSSLFNLNFTYSYRFIYDNHFIEKIINSLFFEDKKIEKFFKEIAKVLYNYTISKLKQVNA